MDDSSTINWLTLTGLLILHFTVVLTESALTHSRSSLLREQADNGDKRAESALRLMDAHVRLSITKHFSLTLIKFALAGVTIAYIYPLYLANDENVLLSPPAALIVLAIVGYVVGELLPDTLGRVHADAWVLGLAPIMGMLMIVFMPIVWLFSRLEAIIKQITGGQTLAKDIIEEEIIDLVESSERGSALEDDERDMIRSVLEFDETMVREIMVPRLDITAVEIDEPLQEALRLFIESGHSRIPVYDDEIDRIEGVLYAKDLLAVWYRGEAERKTIRELMRPAYVIPETKRAEDLFREFQTTNTQLAIVVDEFGSTAGVISVEDIVEEIVGDIRDEYDTTETVEVTKLNEDEFTVDASINLYDFNQVLHADLPTDEHDSLGGYLYEQFGHVPQPGERLERAGLLMRIESVEGVRIRGVHVKRQPDVRATKPLDKKEQPEAALEARAGET